MLRRFGVYMFIIAAMTCAAVTAGQAFGWFRQGIPVSPPPRRHQQTLALLPLDSRPACTQLVEQLGNLANIRLLLPPEQYLDNYTHPGDREALARWLKSSASLADAMIISTDMLLSGGLLASRSRIPTPQEIRAVAELLTDLRRENPRLRLYSFHIIPRLLLADHTPDRHYQRAMQKYSILQDQILQFENPLDIKKLAELETIIPPRIIEEYRLLYARNEEANRAWIELAKNGILDALVIGQDDGYHFGLPNVVKARLESAINSAKLSDRVVLTRGADEVAQTMLGRFANALKPPVRIYVEYSAADAPHIVMPFMSHSVATTVTEKIQLLHATEVATEQQADFILFVHIGRQSSTPGKLQAAAGRLRHLLDSGRSVALVDLAENFYASQTLLPYAIEAGISIDRLTAYAGWNTASNAIGTAVTQAALYTGRQKEGASSLRLHYDNLTFTTARVLDDWHYLKSIQPQIDKKLLRAGIDPYHLQSHRPKTEALIRRAMNERSRLLLRQALNRPFRWPGFEQPFLINAIDPVIQLPWDRTFEIKLDANLELIQLKSP